MIIYLVTSANSDPDSSVTYQDVLYAGRPYLSLKKAQAAVQAAVRAMYKDMENDDLFQFFAEPEWTYHVKEVNGELVRVHVLYDDRYGELYYVRELDTELNP